MALRKLIPALVLWTVSALWLHADKPHVVASFSLPADWVRQVAGDRVELDVLAGNGQDIHAYEPAPRDLAKLSRADLVVEIGAGLEYWLDDMLAASRFQGRRLTLSAPLTLRHANDELDHEEHGDHDTHEHDGHHHGEHDPHVWMDPENVRLMSQILTDALCELDPPNAETYRRNEERWAQHLNDLDQHARERFDKIPVEDRVIITYHDNLGYFAARYGIEIPATILGSISTESGEPSARQMARLIRLIRQDKVGAVFTDPGSNARLSTELCRETGLPAPKALYVGYLSAGPDGPQDYEALFLSTVDTVADSLQTSQHIE
ncbi:MAG: metal ABC transporter substrate-binding protein [Verrucomicrobiota bacterium JB024]|nr:metal ABC transporter substrate-binding protein [Verrucomicrobiota bacterium JB024]